MNQTSSSINTKLIDSIAQIILSLSHEERNLLDKKIRFPSLSSEETKRKVEALKADIQLGIEQLENGQYTEYDESSLPTLLESIKSRARNRIQPEKS